MATLEQQVERIVREVLAQLSAAPGGQSAAKTVDESGAKKDSVKSAAASPDTDAALLRIDSRIVSIAELDGKTGGVKRLAVRRGAIITPAARDFLRERGIAIGIEDGIAKPGARSSSKAGLVVGLASTRFDPAELVRQVAQQGVAIERIANSSLTTVVDELADQIVGSGKLGVLLTSETMAALVLANHHRGVRAVQATRRACVAIAGKAVGANLLIIQPQGKTSFELKRILMAFAEQGPVACPASIARQLA